MHTLVVVDVQNDFCPGGSLATSAGDLVAQRIAKVAGRYDAVLTTQDWHIEPGDHFSPTPNFVSTWPVHCVAETKGAELHPALADMPITQRFFKGRYGDGYSGFEGTDESDTVGMEQWLRDHGVDSIDVAGIATDHCVRATAKDALAAGFAVRILAPLCSPVDDMRGLEVLDELAELGAEVVFTV